MNRRLLLTLIACAMLSAPFAGANDASAWRIDDARHEIALGDVGQGIRIATGPADLVAVEGSIAGQDASMAFEVASLSQRLHDPLVAPAGERLIVHAIWGDLGLIVHRHTNGSMFSQAFHWNGEHQVIHESVAVQDTANDRLVVHMPNLLANLALDGRALDDNDVRVSISVVACQSGGVCGDLAANAWAYGDRLEAGWPLYEDHGACRHLVAECIPDSMIPLLPRDLWPL